jgi:methionyl-tRNA formyltransferase
MSDAPIGLFLLSSRGHSVLTAVLQEFGSSAVAYVVTASDSNVENDYRGEIVTAAERAGVRVIDRKEIAGALPPVVARFTAGWRWLLPENEREPIVVLHDSLLPRYRGFAPLVSALINGERELGVTALLGAAEYDAGPILAQERIAVTYPLRIYDAIEAIRPCYAALATKVLRQLRTRSWQPQVQDETAVSYSLWRDEADYVIDWSLDAPSLRRLVDATGTPYLGATTFADGRKLRVLTATEKPDVRIENRTPGKIIAMEDGQPVVVCGRGLLRINSAIDDQTRTDVLPWTKFRTRFTGV